MDKSYAVREVAAEASDQRLDHKLTKALIPVGWLVNT
jgi:hypothetical protein